MSSIIIIQQAEAVHLITDGAHYERDGTLGLIGSKVRQLPRAETVFALRGIGAFEPFEEIFASCRSFDDVIDTIPSALAFFDLAVRTSVPDAGFPHLGLELVAAGWSDARQAWSVGIASPLPARYPQDQVGISHLPGYVQYEPFVAAPLSCAPPVDIEKAVGRSIPDPAAVNELYPAAAGLAIIEAQRLVPCDLSADGDGFQYVVGGFAELTTVSASGISHRILRTWPDEIGRRLEPAGAESIESVTRRLRDDGTVRLAA
ncbi:hypothetical protein ASE86_13285 [Sphingomonas sp. Leaf33]|uniref:hypothetical protein n=1 Tax=Sphingomonas sp. Leaf33 TaxID=1736215 RepID=UPI0006FDC51B|nr:hypothetical protein [Sphingomonas sp. Leaf33]KQN19439.1 hypothetical protein ASE86_13285 [Sphingomonas sp. Leaf33]